MLSQSELRRLVPTEADELKKRFETCAGRRSGSRSLVALPVVLTPGATEREHLEVVAALANGDGMPFTRVDDRTAALASGGGSHGLSVGLGAVPDCGRTNDAGEFPFEREPGVPM